MSQGSDFDAIIVGAGPNGLAAAITLAQAGQRVLVQEASDTLGGGTRTKELTLPGFLHDVCSAIHPLGLASPFFRNLPLADFGLEWILPEFPLAHPLDDGRAVVVRRSVEETARCLGEDAAAYTSMFAPLVEKWQPLVDDLLAPLRIPKDPLLFTRFGLMAVRPAASLAKSRFRGEKARALFAGHAGHSIQPLENIGTAAFGLVEGFLAHAVGWPMAKGGSQAITEAMAAYLATLGGEIITSAPVSSLADLPPARAILLNVTPRQMLQIAGERLPESYKRQLERFRYGPAVFKLDLALDGPIPWTAEECRRTATLHVGGTLEEIAAAERAVWAGKHPEKPFVILAQHTPFDPSRAPEGKHTAWAYSHVPNGSTTDMTAQIEAQIERFAPGFKDLILARHTFNAVELEAYNPNYVGGDIIGGMQDLRQQWTRPVLRLDPYTTPADDIFICSSSTPPGGGVHGMCGYFAAQAALRQLRS